MRCLLQHVSSAAGYPARLPLHVPQQLLQLAVQSQQVSVLKCLLSELPSAQQSLLEYAEELLQQAIESGAQAVLQCVISKLPAGHVPFVRQQQLWAAAAEQQQLQLLQCLVVHLPRPSSQLNGRARQSVLRIVNASHPAAAMEVVSKLGSEGTRAGGLQQLLQLSRDADQQHLVQPLLMELLDVDYLPDTQLDQLLHDSVALGHVPFVQCLLQKLCVWKLSEQGMLRCLQQAISSQQVPMLECLLTQLPQGRYLSAGELCSLLQLALAQHDNIVLDTLLTKAPTPTQQLSGTQIHMLLDYDVQLRHIPSLQCLLEQFPAASSLPAAAMEQLLLVAIRTGRAALLDCLLVHFPSTATDFSIQQILSLMLAAIDRKQPAQFHRVWQWLHSHRDFTPPEMQALYQEALAASSLPMLQAFVDRYPPALYLQPDDLIQLFRDPALRIDFSLQYCMLHQVGTAQWLVYHSAEQRMALLQLAVRDNQLPLLKRLLARLTEDQQLSPEQVKDLLMLAVAADDLSAFVFVV